MNLDLPTLVTTIAEVVLASVLATAAATKVSGLGAWRTALEGYRIKALSRPALATATPVLESALAALLVFGVEPAASALALLLFLLFAFVLTVAMMRGADVECGCFGELLTARIGPDAILRVAVLAGIAALPLGLTVEAAPGSTSLPIMARLTAVVLVVAGSFVSGRIRARRRASQRAVSHPASPL